MENLSFAQSNERTFTVNGGAEIRFDPASPKFVARFTEMFNAIQEQYEANESRNATDGKQILDILDKQEAFVREKIDSVFGAGICDAIFVDPLAISDGLPVWLNFCMAILDTLDESVVAQANQASPRVDKYMAKYQKYKRK